MPIELGYGKSTSDIENVEWNIATAQLPNVVRYGSGSSQTSQNSGDICRICHCESDPHNPLLTPCYCSGSLKYVHQTCLQQWLTASETNSCELCKFPFIMHTKIKPFNEWRSLDMSGVERRRLFCAVLFHCAAAMCVIWSLCVLIERAAEEVKRDQIGWPFWTKLVVVTVGLTGGVVFMYIQCRQYLHLCHRWRARNRILLIQNAPEKIHPLSPPSPVLLSRHNLPRSSSTTNHGSMLSGGCASGVTQPISGRPSHGQIVANIENNPLHYERDWQLDDSSQSSFRPCPQGSGSMTPMPFHDSVHNMNEIAPRRSFSNSTNGSTTDLNQLPNQSTMFVAHTSPPNKNTVTQLPPRSAVSSTSSAAAHNKTNDLNLFKVHTNATVPISALFLENSDILNDAQYPKLYHRHSTVIADQPPVESGSSIDDRADGASSHRDHRRYSDTKLLHQRATGSGRDSFIPADRTLPIFNVTSVLGVSIPPPTAHDPEPSTEIIFETVVDQTTFDPLELNIQEMLELDVFRQNESVTNAADSRKGRLSLHNVSVNGASGDDARAGGPSNNDSRNFFKSLPNLSASSENLLQN